MAAGADPQDVFVDVLCFASVLPGDLEAEQVDPELEELPLLAMADRELLDAQDAKRAFAHGSRA
jgi:hypothetical protein